MLGSHGRAERRYLWVSVSVMGFGRPPPPPPHTRRVPEVFHWAAALLWGRGCAVPRSVLRGVGLGQEPRCSLGLGGAPAVPVAPLRCTPLGFIPAGPPRHVLIGSLCSFLWQHTLRRNGLDDLVVSFNVSLCLFCLLIFQYRHIGNEI